MKKILFVITKSNWYGAQKYTYQLATSLPRNEYDISVAFGGGGVLGNEPPGLLKSKLEEARIRTVFVPELMRDVFLLTDLRAAWALYKLFCREKPNIIHLSSSKAGGVGAFAARIYSIKTLALYFLLPTAYCLLPRIIFTSHGLPLDEERNPISKLLIRLATWTTFLLCHAVIMISENTYARARAFPWCRSRIHLVYNSLQPYELLSKSEARAKLKPGFPTDVPWIGTIAELTRNKSLDTLVRAAGILKRDGRKFVVCVIGGGEEKIMLEKLIRKEQVEDIFSLVGFVPEASHYLTAFDIFALPSLKEGLPYVLLEAGFAKCAVVASRIPGATDIITHNEHGLLVPVGDPEALAKELRVLIEHANERARFAQALRTRVLQEFSSKQMLTKTETIYKNQS
ncbi:MAG: glycosyltransferase [Candidatus Vogelbacteria bacterium]|nr:glycosyltransferase [Candidatus Vogelbacteria bacterium]